MLGRSRRYERKAVHRGIQDRNGQAGGGARSPGERSRGAPGVSIHSLYAWIKRYGAPEEERKAVDSQADELRRLKAELKRVTEERDILKKAAVYFAKTSG
jgi:transposase-like protein